ncbi:MAG: thioredoxin fold domain-containing protein [Gammaproteobacteria bacterium]|jgi:thioredoxin-related protein|nr:thioredoxin fold domain-containing protein [Gammaproteobacteria bacterium]
MLVLCHALSAALLSLALVASPAAAADAPPAPGKITGIKRGEHPEWFKESFLDIGEDVGEAARAGRHVILFLELDGCPYCYKMVEENFRNAPYAEFIRRHFDVIALNMRGDREVALDKDTTATEKEISAMLKASYSPTVVFLDRDNRPVARVNGYQNVTDFKVTLDYVAEKAYERMRLAQYQAERAKAATYAMRPHPLLKDVTDLRSVADRPLAVLFEDRNCVACDALHDGHLARPEVLKALEDFTFVRLDAQSDAAIVDVEGNPTTMKAYAAKLGVDYRPTIVLFDRGREIVRIASMLYSYHFTGVLEYVGRRHYERYPASPFRYIDAKTAELLKAGKDVPITDD